MNHISARLRKQIKSRAKNRCEYCGLAQAGQEATFHIDHVVPREAGGPTTLANLALACVSCSLRKGARRAAVDPQTGHTVLIYNPRRQRWDDHFRWEDVRLAGLTPTGRATVELLHLNRLSLLRIREVEKALGRHPPK